MKNISYLILISLLMACSSLEEGEEHIREITISGTYNFDPTLPIELSEEQDDSFGVLNSIQLKGYNLYSTFPSIEHDCYPPDSNFVMTAADLKTALVELFKRNFRSIPKEDRSKLAGVIVKAQEEYLILVCNGDEDERIEGSPYYGTWILPEVLGRRDVIMEW